MATASGSSLDGHELIKNSLTSFVSQYIPDMSFDGVDDIILSYLLGVLEDLGSEDGFELDSFVEMMQAYIPGFEDVDNENICAWMFRLADELTNSKEKENTPPKLRTGNESPCTSGDSEAVAFTANNLRCTGGDATNRDSMQSMGVGGESPDLHEKDSNGQDRDDRDDIDAQVRQLLEMFPGSCSVEARQCLATAKGDIVDAVQLMLVKMEEGHATPIVTKDEWKSGKSAGRQKDEKKMRDSILQKYGYVDTHDDSVVHKPAEPKQEKKKMVRYLNGSVCTTKGERFVEIKKPVTEEMKKTFINLKPARKYHFH